jgi:hypothetical protein
MTDKLYAESLRTLIRAAHAFNIISRAAVDPSPSLSGDLDLRRTQAD